MKEVVILSGKGGTGKTSLTAALAYLSESSVLCDADVDAADLHLLTAPDIRQRHDFTGRSVAAIIRDSCTECGQCLELCRFDAVGDNFEIDQIACEGCGVCVDLCPEQAIDFPVKTCGQWFISDTRFGSMVHARLGIAEENSGKLVTLVRHEAKKVAETKDLDLIITDGPPGVGCPVIASARGATVLVIVTEPTVSGIHDMERVLELAAHFSIPAMICINKYDLNMDQTAAIERLAKERQIPMAGKVPFDPLFTTAMVRGNTIFEEKGSSRLKAIVRQLWKTIISSSPMSR